MRGHVRLLGTVAAFLILYALAGFLLVPHLARSAIEDYVRDALRRQVSIAALSFNPFTLTAELRGVALAEADGAPIAGFERLVINAELSSIFHWAWTCKEIRIESPSVSAVIDADGSLNLDRLKPPAPAGRPAPASSGTLPAIRIGLFAVRAGRVRFEDRSRGKPFTATLQPIEFTLEDFRTTPQYQNSYQFEGVTLAGERLSWAGEFTVQPLGSRGRFAVGGLKAATIAAYLQDSLPFDLPSGVLDIQGEYRIALGANLGLSIQLPTLQLHDIGIAPKQGDEANPWIRVPALSVSDAQIMLGERKVSVGNLQAVGAQLTVWREPDGQLNLQRLFPQRTAVHAPEAGVASARGGVTSAAPGKPTARWTVSVTQAQLRDASVHAEDRTTRPTVATTLAPISLTVNGYSTVPGSKLSVEAAIGIAQASFGARGSLSADPLSADIGFDLRDYDLTMLQPYIAQQADLLLGRGRLNAKGRLVLANAPARHQPKLQLSGDFEVADLLTRDGLSRSDFISWDSLRISGLHYQRAPDRLSIERIVARKPYGRVVIAAPELDRRRAAAIGSPQIHPSSRNGEARS